MKFARSATPTGYEAHAAAARDGERMAAAARQAVNEGVSFDDEMIEVDGAGQQPPNGERFGTYGKAGGRGASGNRAASSSHDLDRHDPLHGSRRQSPEMPDRRHPTPFSSVGHIPADSRTTRDIFYQLDGIIPLTDLFNMAVIQLSLPAHSPLLTHSITLLENEIRAARRHLPRWLRGRTLVTVHLDQLLNVRESYI